MKSNTSLHNSKARNLALFTWFPTKSSLCITKHNPNIFVAGCDVKPNAYLHCFTDCSAKKPYKTCIQCLGGRSFYFSLKKKTKVFYHRFCICALKPKIFLAKETHPLHPYLQILDVGLFCAQISFLRFCYECELRCTSVRLANANLHIHGGLQLTTASQIKVTHLHPLASAPSSLA